MVDNTDLNTELISELDCLIEYYKQLSVDRISVDTEMAHYYRGAASSLNLFASWLQRSIRNESEL